jgi:hypothetical protein
VRQRGEAAARKRNHESDRSLREINPPGQPQAP